MMAAGLCSCTKYLDIKPYGQTIPQTAEEFSAIIHDRINEIDYGEETIIGNVISVCYTEAYADNLEPILQDAQMGRYIPLYIGEDLSDKQHYYSRLYEVIKDCNIIIGYLNDRESELGRNVLGTAYAIRGVCYYNLLRDFCDPCVNNGNGLGVPIVTEFDMEARPARSTIAQTVEQAENDMLAAISYDISDEMYRFNSDVMRGYLARLYFWAGNWSAAARYARDVLNTYPLINGNAYIEMLESDTAIKGNILFKSCIIRNSNIETDNDVAQRNLSYRPVSKEYVDLFTEDGENDIRYTMSFDSKRTFKKNVFACLRSAEMQLILAESLYHQGNKEGAIAALNELRRNRITGVTDYTEETLPEVNTDDIISQDACGKPLTPLIYAILCERRKELFMEGDRWYELKRNGRPERWTTRSGLKYTTFSYMYTFPLPIDDVELVEGLVQNPGYENVR